MFHLKSAKITAPSNGRRWGGCLVEGGLLILLEVETDGDVIASHSGKAILDQIINSFQTSFKQNKLNLKDLLDEVASNPFIKNLSGGLAPSGQQ